MLEYVDCYNQAERPFNWKFTAATWPAPDRISAHEHAPETG